MLKWDGEIINSQAMSLSDGFSKIFLLIDLIVEEISAEYWSDFLLISFNTVLTAEEAVSEVGAIFSVNIMVRQSRQSGVARATCPD